MQSLGSRCSSRFRLPADASITLATMSNIEGTLPAKRQKSTAVANPLACLPWSILSWTSDGYRPGNTMNAPGFGWLPPAVVPDKSSLEHSRRVLQAALAPITAEAAQERLWQVWGSTKFTGSKDDQKRRLAAMAIELVRFETPPDLLEVACRRWVAESPWWPAFAELWQYIKGPLGERRRRIGRLAVLERVHQEPAPEGLVEGRWLRRIRYRDGYVG